MNQEDNTQWGRAWKDFRAASWGIFEALSQNEMVDQDGDKNERGDNDFNENEVGWIGAKPPYYSGGWSIASSTLNIIGGGIFSTSISFLHDSGVEHWFWRLCPTGIVLMAVAWIFMGIHGECERQKSKRQRADDQKNERIGRYCKRYKKAAKLYSSKGGLVSSYALQALSDARPQFLRSNDELKSAFLILREMKVPPDIGTGWNERDLRKFLINAKAAHVKLLSADGILNVGMWMNGYCHFVESERGDIRFVDTGKA